MVLINPQGEVEHKHTPSSLSPLWDRFLTLSLLYLCVQEVANRSTTYKATVEEEDDDEDRGVEASEESVFLQQVRDPCSLFS